MEDCRIPTLDECLETHGLPGIHPAAGLFPLIDNDEMLELIESISSTGLEQDIVLTHDGLLLDGRNRLIACTAAKAEPRFRRLPEDHAEDYWGYAIRMNMLRRHLTASQRAAIAVKAKERYAEMTKEKLRACGGWRGNQYTKPEEAVVAKVPQAPDARTERAPGARELAARDLSVGCRYVNYAERIRDADPELFEEIVAGKKTIKQALREIQPDDADEDGYTDTEEAPPTGDIPITPQTEEEVIWMAQKFKAANRQATPAKAAGSTNGTGEPDAAEPPENLILGDAREGLLCVQDESIDCVITDPPYGIGYVPQRRAYADMEKRAILGDRNVETAATLWEDVCRILHQKMKPDSHMYVFTAWKVCRRFTEITSRYFTIRNTLIWAKNGWGMGNYYTAYGPEYELIIFATKGNRSLTGPDSGDVLHFDRVNTSELTFSVQKPVGLIEHLLRRSTAEGELVVDPFTGSGSTLIACQNLGRRWIGIEADETAYGIACKRLAGALERAAGGRRWRSS